MKNKSSLWFLVVFLLGTVFPSQAIASPIFAVSSSTLLVTGVFVTGASLPIWDIRGALLLDISDPTSGMTSAPLSIFDPLGGVGLIPALPFGNTQMFADDGHRIANFDSVVFRFDLVQDPFSNPAFDIMIPASITPAGKASQALTAFAAASPVPFYFSNTYAAGNGTQSILQWTLASVGVPEPGSITMVFGGVLAMSGLAWRRARRQ